MHQNRSTFNPLFGSFVNKTNPMERNPMKILWNEFQCKSYGTNSNENPMERNLTKFERNLNEM